MNKCIYVCFKKQRIANNVFFKGIVNNWSIFQRIANIKRVNIFKELQIADLPPTSGKKSAESYCAKQHMYLFIKKGLS